MFMSQGQTKIQGLQTASPITHLEPCRRQNDPPCSSSPSASQSSSAMGFARGPPCTRARERHQDSVDPDSDPQKRETHRRRSEGPGSLGV
jgi:hypothetical protein